jgi:hypothetical protein
VGLAKKHADLGGAPLMRAFVMKEIGALRVPDKKLGDVVKVLIRF